jgi:MFS family permease
VNVEGCVTRDGCLVGCNSVWYLGVGQVVRWACACLQIGGLLIGLLGDKIGRKRATLYAVCGMTVATVGQGCLPSRRTGGSQAEATGMWMLLVLRCIQVCCALSPPLDTPPLAE